MRQEMFFGSQYYRPPFPGRECWERDMANMRNLGFNTIKLWAVWNWIEPEQGNYDFEDLDRLVQLASAHGLRVMLNTIPEGAPYWTLAGNEDSLYVTKSGERITYGGPPNLPSAGWPGLCIDKPSSAELVCGFIERVSARYARNDAVAIIDVWNEPHLEPMFDYRSDMLCYCPHSKTRFREWLQRKYQSLEALNETWFRRYRDWSEVTPPPRFGTWTDMMDWRLFWIENLRRHLALRVAAARKGAPEKLVQTHVAYSAVLGNKLTGGLSNELGDEFSLAPEVDIFGLSSFPKWLQGRNHYFTHLAHNEMVAEASREKPFYQVELQGGAGKAGLLGGEVPDDGDVRVWNYNTIASGGKGVVYWQYAAEPAGLESPGFGLTGFLGENTPRSTAAGDCARLFRSLPLDTARRLLPSNAIYVSRRSEVLCFCADRKEDLYAASVAGVYKAAYQSLIPVRFIHEDYVEHLIQEKTGTLFLPMPLVLTEREIECFLRFVENGGTLAGEACAGMYDGTGRLREDNHALRRLFGLDHVELQGLPDWGFTEAGFEMNGRRVDGETFSGKQYRQVVRPHDGTSVLSRFEDGSPAVTERSMGRGKSVFIATFSALGFHEQEDAGTRRLLTRYFRPGGYPEIRNIRISGRTPDAGSLAPVVRLLATENEYLLVAVNHTRESVEIEVEFAGPLLAQGTRQFRIPARDGVVLRLDR